MASLKLNTQSGGSVTIVPTDTAQNYTISLPVSANGSLLTTTELDAQLTTKIGVTIQGYDANTAKYNATTANFTGALQKSGSNVLTASDIGTSVQAYDEDLTAWAGKTAPTGNAVGTTDTQTLTNKTLTTPIITGAKETKTTSSGNNFDLSAGSYFTHTLSGATSLTVSNTAASGNVSAFVVDLTNGGSATITWWSGVKWASGTAPTLTTSGRDILGFFTHDGGTTWNGLVLAKDIK